MKGMRYISSAFPRLHRFLSRPLYLFRLWQIRRELDAVIRRAEAKDRQS